jgi:DNA-binding response OmpR family regulator
VTVAPRVLIVEDEAGLRLTLTDRLGSEGYAVDTASDGEAGLARATTGGYDLVVLDVMLPRMNGFDVCRELRQRGVTTPILMLTARGQVVDKVVGLKLGADDYLTKPFETIELMARLEALLRRAPSSSQPGGETYRWRSPAPASCSTSRRASSSCCGTSSRIAAPRCPATNYWRTCGATTRCR